MLFWDVQVLLGWPVAGGLAGGWLGWAEGLGAGRCQKEARDLEPNCAAKSSTDAGTDTFGARCGALS